MVGNMSHSIIEVTRTVTIKYRLRPGAYPNCTNEEVIKRETDDFDITDFAITLRHKQPEDVDMVVSFEILDS
jgi:hypothetical protein